MTAPEAQSQLSKNKSRARGMSPDRLPNREAYLQTLITVDALLTHVTWAAFIGGGSAVPKRGEAFLARRKLLINALVPTEECSNSVMESPLPPSH
ncbi:hypothetical protein CEXT_534211 [Caerostris extrusa]|uniref:Uncharacterized protein n=1 Tax=Caerostris extrusa TaxID=172846 RepID=A0AAV4QNR6_CAEEX|nr:hypothetical protein CEXT_534211 [Caerostris extrusa]